MSVQLARKFSQINIKSFSRCSTPFAANQRKYYCTADKTDKLPTIMHKNLEEETEEKSLSTSITVRENENVMAVSGMPVEQMKGRLVRIYQKPKNAMQSGTNNTHCWEMEFETRQRWENPLMGWCSSGDPVSNIKLQFPNAEAASNFANKHGYEYFIDYERKEKPKVKSYGFNFSWNKRTRVSTK